MGTRPPPAFAQATLDVVADPLGEAKAAAASASSSVASIGSRLRPTAALIEAATMDSTAQPSAADVAELLRTGKQGAAAGTQRPRALKKRSAGSICACTRSCTLAARARASRGSCACACACACRSVCLSVCLSGWLAGLAGWLSACLSVCLAWRGGTARGATAVDAHALMELLCARLGHEAVAVKLKTLNLAMQLAREGNAVVRRPLRPFRRPF
jgi:hypothetical protein